MDRRGTIYVLLAGISWGLIGLFSRTLNEVYEPVDMVVIRGIGAAIGFTLIFLTIDRKAFRINVKDVKYFIGTGIVSFIMMNICYFTCMRICSLAVSTLRLYTGPTFVVIMSAIIFKEKMTGTKLLALLMTFAGCVFVTGLLESDVNFSGLGILLGVCSGFFYGLFSIFGKFVLEKYSSYTLTLYTFILAAMGCIFISDPTRIFKGFSDPNVVIAAILLIVVGTLIPYTLYSKGLERIESGKASIMATLEPVVATLISVYLWGERLSVIGIAGILLIIFAVCTLAVSGQKSRGTQHEIGNGSIK